jgi:hypothetical protein
MQKHEQKHEKYRCASLKVRQLFFSEFGLLVSYRASTIIWNTCFSVYPPAVNYKTFNDPKTLLECIFVHKPTDRNFWSEEITNQTI